jgi:hydrogenase expression/formation protein HypC
MCLAVPMKLIKRGENVGVVELGGVEREISLMLLSDAKVGEYLMVHAGFAIQRLDEEEAHKTLEILAEMSDIAPEELGLDLENLNSQEKEKQNFTKVSRKK